MSHQTKYTSRFTSMQHLCTALEHLNFARIPGQRQDATSLVYRREDTHAVTLTALDSGEIQISTDLHWGNRSAKIKELLGTPENSYEPLATLYNQYLMMDHFIQQGYEVSTETMETGEVHITVNVGNW